MNVDKSIKVILAFLNSNDMAPEFREALQTALFCMGKFVKSRRIVSVK